MNLSRTVCLFILGALCVFENTPLYANNQWKADARFERFTWKKSLIKGIARDILQDHDGHLWLVGRNGIVKYDGYISVAYQPDSGVPSPIEKLAIDENGDVYAANERGEIFKYHREKAIFKVQDFPAFRIVSENHKPIHFIDTNGYLYRFNSDDNLEKITYLSAIKQSTKINDSLVQDNLILLATSNGLIEIESTSSDTVETSLYDQNSFYTLAVWKDKILVGGENKLYSYDPLKKELSVDNEDINSSVYSLLSASDGNLWIGTYQTGLYVLDRNEKLTAHITNDKLDQLSVPSNNVFSLYEDMFENVWVGTDGGVARYNSFENSWKHTRKSYSNNLVGNSVSQIATDKRGRIWIGTHHDGISVFNPDGTHIKNLSQTAAESNRSDIENIKDNSIYSLHSHSDGYMWIGHHAGIEKVDIQNFKVTSIDLSERCQRPQIRAFSIQEAYGDTWVGTQKNGLLRLNGNLCKVYEKNSKEEYSLETNTIYEVYKDITGKIWLTTPKDLYLYIAEGDNFKSLSELVDQKTMLPKTGFNTIIQAASDEYWIGTAGHGIKIFNWNERTIDQLTAADGIKNQDINGLKIKNNIVFASTNNGLYAVDRRTKTVLSFSLNDGLQEDEFNLGASFKTEKGELIFGGVNGFNIFTSDIIDRTRKSAIPQIGIQSSKRGNIALFSSAANPESPLLLYYDDFPITIYLKSIHLANGDSNKVDYRFDQSSDWKTLEGSSSLVFRELDYGPSLLSVRASADKAPHNERIAIAELKVIPPPWKTQWAYLSYFSVVILVLYMLYRWRVQAIKRRSMELENLVSERTEEVVEQKKTIEAQYEELDKVSAEQTRFFENISHEFRTPLTLILGPVRNLMQLTSNQKTKQQLTVVNRNAARLLNLIDQLLDISRLNSGLKTISKEPIELSPFIDEVLSDFNSNAESNKVRLVNEVDLKLSILFDAESLQRILLNLVSNAIKYNRPGGKVRIYCARNEGLELVISDTGIGIEENHIDTIFDRFSRVKNDKNVSGTGIGLALVYELVTLNGSSIQVQSEVGKGTKFKIRLEQTKMTPAEDIQHIKNQTAIDSLPTSPSQISSYSELTSELTDVTKSRNFDVQLLIVDDDTDMRNYIVSVLESYSCSTAENGKVALSEAIENVPDLIVTDAMMPEMDGFELVRQLRSNPITNHIPILILTARGSRYSKLEGLQTGTDDYLTKPFNELELCQRIENLLDNRRLLREKFSSDIYDQNTGPNTNQQDKKFTDKLNKILINNFADPEFNVVKFANEFATSERQLQRKLKAIYGFSPTETIKRFRLHQAKLMLMRGETVSVTCYAVGFSSLSHFSKAFKEAYQVAPSNLNK